MTLNEKIYQYARKLPLSFPEKLFDIYQIGSLKNKKAANTVCSGQRLRRRGVRTTLLRG